MKNRVKELAVSALMLSIIAYLIWPWRGPAWFTYLPGPLRGDLEVLTLVVLVTLAAGTLITAVGGIHLSNLAIGGIFAYAFWMAVLTIFFPLHDPIPYILYGMVLIGILLGAAVGKVINRKANLGNYARSF